MTSSDKLQETARRVRIRSLETIYSAGGGHTGGSLSSTDILVALYFHTMRYSSSDQSPDRDRFILSKGHSVESFYSVLSEAGFFPPEELETYGKFGSSFFGHPTMKVPGVEVPTGALGHGLSVGVGMALSAKRDATGARVFVLMGDGELAEGSVWEAAMSASHYGLGNLVGIIDHNKLQISGAVDDVMAVGPLNERWRSFGWETHEIDGNDMDSLLQCFDALTYDQDKPSLIIAHTIKGKGVSFMENNAAWHHRVPTEDELRRALDELSMSSAGAAS